MIYNFAFAAFVLCGSGTEPVVEYAADGKVFRRYHITEEGILEGLFIEYHPNGRIKLRARYRKGRLHGLYERFDKQGRPTSTSLYIEGTLAYPLLRKQVEAQLRKLRSVSAPKVFDQNPRASPPYRAGRLSAPTVQNALVHLKRYRFLCGLPYEDLSIKPDYAQAAQHAAVLLAVLGRLDHQPPKPHGMPQDFYALAKRGCMRSNLYVGTAGLIGAIDGFMYDSDPKNIQHLGHRRWLLNPPMLFTGFGLCGSFAVVYAHDSSRRPVPKFDFIPFPPRGFIPGRFITPGHAWSVSLNPKLYEVPKKTGELRIKVIPLDRRLKPVDSPLQLERVNVSRMPYGVPLCVIFRPRFKAGLYGRRFLVDIPGIKVKAKDAPHVRYYVEIGGKD